MAKLKLIFTNLLTAVITAVVVSAFWIYAYGNRSGGTDDKVEAAGDKVVLAGDINTWQNNKGGRVAHDQLVKAGYFDTANAQSAVNLKYSTINHFKTRVSPGATGFGSRIDVIMVKGSRGAKRFVNVMKPVDSSRPSDHNMIVADVVL